MPRLSFYLAHMLFVKMSRSTISSWRHGKWIVGWVDAVGRCEWDVIWKCQHWDAKVKKYQLLEGLESLKLQSLAMMISAFSDWISQVRNNTLHRTWNINKSLAPPMLTQLRSHAFCRSNQSQLARTDLSLTWASVEATLAPLPASPPAAAAASPAAPASLINAAPPVFSFGDFAFESFSCFRNLARRFWNQT